MNKANWVTIWLGGMVPKQQIEALLEMSLSLIHI